jgi:hypothetical protein
MNHTGPQIGIRLRSLGRPSLAGTLTEADVDLMDDAQFAEFLAWDKRRVDGGAYHLGDFNPREVFAWMRWLKCQRITLRQRLRESASAKHIRELEAENNRLSASLANQSAGVAPGEKLRQENAALRADLAACKRALAKWQIQAPSRKGRG